MERSLKRAGFNESKVQASGQQWCSELGTVKLEDPSMIVQWNGVSRRSSYWVGALEACLALLPVVSTYLQHSQVYNA